MGRLSLYLSLHHRNRGGSLINKRQIDRSHSGRQVRRMRSVSRMDQEEEEDERQVSKKRKLDDIELMKLVDYDDDNDTEAPLELEVVSAREEEGVVDMEGLRGEFCHMSDFQLQEKIGRIRGHLSSMSMSLPDNGVKLRSSIKRMEAEAERRKRDKGQDACAREIPPQSKALNPSGAAAGLNQETPLSNGKTHSIFFSTFEAKLDEQSDNQPKKISNGQFVSKRGQTSRAMPYQCPTRLASNRTNHTHVNCDRRENLSAVLLSHRSLPSRLIQKAGAPHINSVHARRRQEKTIVLLDDEDSELDEDDSPSDKDMHFDDMQRQLGDLENFRGSKISYPSRDDPAHVDIDFFDIKCLDPEAYLSSPIMNFYIRYLQQLGSPPDTSKCDYQFFNTFFYSKLKEAVSYKGNDNTSFAKFRRWWRGINIFHKAYILIPVHEDLHWSLIIICIPYKDKENGPIVLHLDSLGLHYSRPIFENIRRFIREEWEFLTHECPSSDLPWTSLPRRIEERAVMVPQQKNDYDCGLFVLYFMERFIAEAPKRLIRKDLQMFSRQWFRPTEASALRTKIRSILLKEFETANQFRKDNVMSKQPFQQKPPIDSEMVL